jgi:hypothetical protein
LDLDLPDRIAVNTDTARLFLSFGKMRVRSRGEVELVGQLVADLDARYDKTITRNSE